MWNILFPKRYTLLKAFTILFLTISFLVRLTFILWNFSEVDTHFGSIARTFVTGLIFDIGTLSMFLVPFLLYLIILPKKWYASYFDKVSTWFGFFLAILIIYFSFFGEFTFWDEFQRRFNFIAVDYLIYTYEVVKNINESYPLPLLLGSLITLVVTTLFICYKWNLFQATFKNGTTFKQRLIATLPWVAVCIGFGFFINNDQAEWSKNRYNNEISKAGIYSFFAAFRNNELAYSEFYSTIPETEAFTTIKKQFPPFQDEFTHPDKNEIYRTIHSLDTTGIALKPNIIFICIESLSGKYLNSMGSDQNITPVLDSLVNQSLFFNNLYATGTRTVRGMEAITLSIPPTPGRSIVKRNNNTGLFTIGEVFKQKGYNRNFFYGGDGYFDNMNTFFGGNGFNIIDRGRGFLLDAAITVKRTNIEDEEVTFENAWGVCDTDLYNKVLKEADIAYKTGKPFFDFIMTTSNHKPFSYPEGKIDIPSGTGRNGAVKYTDYAIGAFLKEAKTKPWFKNTVFVIMSDHCASSAGKWELDVANYHIPAFIYNLPHVQATKINTLCSQIDIFPTLFSTLGWEYKSNLFGMDILKMKPQNERALIGNYRKLGYLKDGKVLVLGDEETVNFYKWNAMDNGQQKIPMDESFKKIAISNYQVADELYHNGGLQLKSLNQ